MTTDDEAFELGRRLRRLRQTRGRSLADVAHGTDLTVSFLSRLERGQTGVTVDTLRRIAAFWGLQIVDMFDRGDGPKPLVIRGGNAPVLQVDANRDVHARAETLIPRSGTALQGTLYRTPPGGGRFEPFAHPGEELVYVVSGRLTYFVADETYELSAGDAIWYTSDRPHRWETGSEQAVTLHVNTPPAW